MRESLQAQLDGYVQPDLYGVGAVTPDGARFPVTNADGFHRLPAVVLATVLGYRSGSHTIEVSRADLERAVEVLAPAEACTEFDHPNLWSWRDLLELEADAFVAVFLADRAAPPADRFQAALVDQARH